MYIDEPEILDQAITKTSKNCTINTPRKICTFLPEIVKKTVNKTAVVHLAEKSRIDKKRRLWRLVTKENDRSMLEVVGNPVVMENGTDELKKSPNTLPNQMTNQALHTLLGSGFLN